MLLESIHLKNLLSFAAVDLPLRPLNVLIGANASGKSNLVSAFRLLGALPDELATNRVIEQGGGASEWIRKDTNTGPAEIGLRFSGHPGQPGYEVAFGGTTFAVFYRERLLAKGEEDLNRQRLLGPDQPQQSMLREMRSTYAPDAGRFVADSLASIRIYQDFDTGLDSPIRLGISTAAPKAWLEEDGRNLPLVLSELDITGELAGIKRELRRFYDRFEDLKVRLEGGRAVLIAKEAGLDGLLPAARMSDGMLRFLCLMAILKQPQPPPLICLEEPESGMHPDAMRMIGEALQEAAGHTQLIVTTHSRELVDAISDTPEAVVVCEHAPETGTVFERLRNEDLDEWLERYTLGTLWMKGQIGGVR